MYDRSVRVWVGLDRETDFDGTIPYRNYKRRDELLRKKQFAG